MKVCLVLRLTSMPMNSRTKYQTMNCQSTLRKMNPNKTRKAGDDATAAVPLAERTQPLELSVLQLRTDRETCSKTWTKRPTMFLTVL